jgi:hypothetical protein
MATWTSEELDRVGNAEELGLASRRKDGTLRPYVTMWVVRAGNDVYVRSAYGPGNPWYRRAKASGSGRIRAGGVERDAPSPTPPPTPIRPSTRPTTPSTTAAARPSSDPSSGARPHR